MPTAAYTWSQERIAALRGDYVPGGPLARAFYVDGDVLAAELDLIWRRHWLYAGHACELAKPGDWLTWNVGADAVVVVHGGDGTLRAFHNVCRHRGSRICSAEHGHGTALVCPYHAWTYDLEGRLKTATEREFGTPRSDLGLLPVALKNVGGLLFVALSDNAVPFDAAEAEIAPKMAHQGFGEAKLAKRLRYHVKANWKLVFENNRECYHCAHAHPEYTSGTYDVARLDPNQVPLVDAETVKADARFRALGLDGAIAASAMTGDYWRCTRAPLMAGWRTQSLDGQPIGPLMGTMRARNAWSDGTLRCTVFQNFWQHASDDHAVATRLTPVDAATTQVDVSWFVHRDAVEARDYTLDRLLPFWQRTSEQDWTICEANQAGVASPAYRPGPYSKTRETNVQQFVDWYLQAMAELERDARQTKVRAHG